MKWLLLAAIALLVSTSAFPNESNIPRRESMGPYWLILTIPEAQADLKLTEPQLQAVNKFVQAFQRPPNQSALVLWIEPLNKAMVTLTPEQRSRLDQLWAQHEGPSILQAPAFARALALTPEQVAEVKRLWSAYEDRTSRADWVLWNKAAAEGKNRWRPEDARSHYNEMLAKFKGDYAATNRATLALLTKDQRLRFDHLKGKPIRWKLPRQI